MKYKLHACMGLCTEFQLLTKGIPIVRSVIWGCFGDVLGGLIWGCFGDLGYILRCLGTSWADKLTPNRGPRTDRKSTETALCAGSRFCRFSVGPRGLIWGCVGDLGNILRCSGTTWADKLTPNRGLRTDRKSTETKLCAGTRFCRFSVGPRGLIWGCVGDLGNILRCSGTTWADKLTPNRGLRTDRKSTETKLCAGTRFCRFSVGPKGLTWGCVGDLGNILRCSGTT
jgi:hypothetical protein